MKIRLSSVWLTMSVFLLVASSANAQSIFQSVATEANIDYAGTTEFPAHTGVKGAFANAPSRNEGLAGALHIRGVMAPHASWLTDETDQKQRYLRIAFKEALPIGTIIGSEGEISYLKKDGEYPGDVTKDDQWVKVPVPEGQAGERVIPFPPDVTTRAIRFSFTDPLLAGGKSRSGFGGALIIKARLHNLTPEATAYASSQTAGAANVIEATRVQNLVTGGTWKGEPKQDISPEHPEWVVLTWPTAKKFSGVGFINAFAKVLEVDALNADEQGNPAVAPETSWQKIGALTWPILWRPAYTDAFLPFTAPVTTRAIRVRIPQPLTKENADIAGASRGTLRKVSLGGVMTFNDLATLPVPPRPKEAAELPPIKIPFTMPYDGKIAIAIDDAAGKRVRNLLADEERKAGESTAAWDGRDDAGRLLTPGTYTVKSITHKPLHITYQATVNCSGNPPWWKSANWGDQVGAGSWLSDHVPPNDVTSIGDKTFVGANIAESGHTILACDLDGNKLWGTKWLETAGAGYLTNDGKKVYSSGEGGWIGERLMIHEIDPVTFKWRRVSQLVFDTGNTPTGGLSGIAARDGKLYVAFNREPNPWLRSAIATSNVDTKNSTLNTTAVETLLALLRTKGPVPPHTAWSTEKSPTSSKYLLLAFNVAQPVGTIMTINDVSISALKPDVAFPGDTSKDEQWIPISAASVRSDTAKNSFAPPQTGMYVYTAPANLSTRALRFSFSGKNAEGKLALTDGGVVGAMITGRRFSNVLPGAAFTASSGQPTAVGAWKTVQDKPITSTEPATLTAVWTEAKTFRGLAFLNFFAKRAEIDIYTGPLSGDPAKAPDSAWTKIGEVKPAVRWRAAYGDDYFDVGKDVTSKALRLRVVEPFVNENADIQTATGGKTNCAGLGALFVLQHLDGDPVDAEVPSQRISVVDIATGKWERQIAVPTPKFPHFDANGNLTVVSGKQVVRVNIADGKVTPLIVNGLDDPRGIAFDATGNLYVADGKTNVIKVFSATGKPLRTLCTPGGRVLGAYDRTRIENPRGISIDSRGHLWVAESDYQPKRTSLWTTDGKFLNEFIGPARYGSGGFIDTVDKSRFYYEGMEFSLDWKTGKWSLKNILSRSQPSLSGGSVNHPVYLNNKQYMVNDPETMGSHLFLVGEFRKDRVVPLTAIGNAEVWKPFKDDPALSKLMEGKPLNAYSFTWSDQNGDGLPQVPEVSISELNTRLNSTYWPSYVNKKLQVQMGGRILTPLSYTACGAPVYKPFDVKPLTYPVENIYAAAIDGKGRVLINGRPVTALEPDGKTAWTYPQKWVGVHDSQVAPSPKPGQMIGGLGFVGQEDVPGIGETFMISSNKGAWYLFSDDGILVATVWHDYREPGVISWNFPVAERGMSLDNVTLGEEHFGGGYFRTGDGKYYLVAGHNHNSIAELTGLETMKRQQTTLKVSDKDILAAEVFYTRQAIAAAQKELPKIIAVANAPTPVKPDGNLAEWKPEQFTAIGKRGSFAVAKDATNFYLAFQVDNNNAMRNAGDDPNMLFKTGDSVDMQIGIDSKANPARTAPVPGDQRLLITIYKGKPVGVLYKHRVPGTPATDKTGFASPSRIEYVDKIVQLDPSNIGIARNTKGYAVEAVVPLALLGFTPQAGQSYKADFGILSADSSGAATQVRSYWANQATGIVSDVPSEIMLTPGLWGEIRW
ncbi:MAG: FlgD immunoglobulin-like domain containing protein [Victivallales bacterium]|jgi:hypothetical protein